MIILGISDQHDAHACIVRDGHLVAAIGEERISRLKSDCGYPRGAIDAVIRSAGITPEEIDVVAFASKSDWIWQQLYKRTAKFSVEDWVDECDFYWKPVLLEKKEVSQFAVIDHFASYIDSDDPYLPALEQVRKADHSEWQNIGDAVRARVLEDHLGIQANKIATFPHEDCHKIYGLYSSPERYDEALVFTMEGGGDYSSATVSTLTGNGNITEHWASNRVMAGRLYAYITLMLGMKPGQHEYKVMGLAPYGTEYHGNKSLEYFRQVNRVVGTEIVNDEIIADMYFTPREALKAQRFDGIAWGLQEWLEELVCDWITNNCRERDLRNVILSGGIGQNIKVSKAIAALPDVENFWAGPITGDGSLAIGAAWLASQQYAPDTPIEGLTSVYLGTEHGSRSVAEAVERRQLSGSFTVIDRPGPERIAKWLNDGQICARFSGRMEFGQRALGNRSILADPRRAESVERVNQKIKYRDFWMPFTPSMTLEESQRMLDNPKGVYSPYMTLAFDLKPEYQGSIPAATHPGDKTVRPQMLKREDNEGYYDLMNAFAEHSGHACLMNTSFNLHGEAIVESPDDAIDTFLRSELDVLLFDDVAISRHDHASS